MSFGHTRRDSCGERDQHPNPPHHELRQKRVVDIEGRLIGQIENLYVDDDGQLQFVDVVTSGFLGLRTNHHLVPVEVIAEEGAGSVNLEVDQQDVESTPTYATPHSGPDEELQDTTREHYGYL
jgi:sporulation protein YlmC with PRC-barrel domain